MSKDLNNAIEVYVRAAEKYCAQETAENIALLVAAWRHLRFLGRAKFGGASATMVFSLIRARFGPEGMAAVASAYARPGVARLFAISQPVGAGPAPSATPSGSAPARSYRAVPVSAR